MHQTRIVFTCTNCNDPCEYASLSVSLNVMNCLKDQLGCSKELVLEVQSLNKSIEDLVTLFYVPIYISLTALIKKLKSVFEYLELLFKLVICHCFKLQSTYWIHKRRITSACPAGNFCSLQMHQTKIKHLRVDLRHSTHIYLKQERMYSVL